MEIKINEEELFLLSKMVYLGNWLISSYKTEFTEEDDKYSDIESKIFKYLKQTKHKNLVSGSQNDYEGSHKFHGLIEKNIEDYNRNNFTTYLIEILSDNHLKFELGTDKYENLTDEEYIELIDDMEEKLLKQIKKKGFKSLSL